MAHDPITGALNIGSQLIERLWPTPETRDAAKLELLKLHQAGELAGLDAQMRTNLAQIELNKTEVGTDLFRGGWRPAAGWICALSLAYEFLLRPLLPWLANAAGASVQPMPSIDNQELMTLLFGMLGLAGARTVERIRGKA